MRKCSGVEPDRLKAGTPACPLKTWIFWQCRYRGAQDYRIIYLALTFIVMYIKTCNVYYYGRYI